MWLDLLIMKYIHGQFGPKSMGPTENNKQEILGQINEPMPGECGEPGEYWGGSAYRYSNRL